MSAESLLNLPMFVFGTLMDEDLLRIVLGHAIPEQCREVAHLKGWRRPVIAGRTYPMLRPHATGRVAGLLLRDLNEQDRDRLDYYEGPEYRLGVVEVRSSGGTREQALAYLCPEGIAAGGRDWRLETWRLRHKRAAIARVRGLMAGWRP
jgi:gamma-glutamylcyclotransferase (GGCT)/AIG2-like uncharacterized protein YtfP